LRYAKCNLYKRLRGRRLRPQKKQPEALTSSCCSRTEILVRLAGIEPTTPWFVAKYSIQLSYSRHTFYSNTRARTNPIA
jgi:hypothetical protein